MALFAQQTKTLTVPGGPPDAVTIRRLTRGELREIDRLRKAEDPEVDAYTLGCGIVSWRSDQPLCAESFDALTGPEIFFLIVEIMTFSNALLEEVQKEPVAPSPRLAGEGADTLAVVSVAGV